MSAVSQELLEGDSEMDGDAVIIAVACGECGTPIQEAPGTSEDKRQPCPSCGSKTRLAKIHIEEKIEMHDWFEMEGREAGKKKPFLEARGGEDLYRKTGEWNQVEQVVDRRNNRYRKRVVDPRTGKVLRDVDELLTDHKAYGSAKKP